MNDSQPKILVERDGDGYLARVRGSDNLFAYGLTKEQAMQELSLVIAMTEDFQPLEKY
jgi:hypothetical protein